MAHNENYRVITLGYKSPTEKQIPYNPIHHYDEEVEFVNNQTYANPQSVLAVDDSAVKSKISSVTADIYSYYQLNTEAERQTFLKGEENPIKPFMQTIIGVANLMTKQEEQIYAKIKDLVSEMKRVYDVIKNDPQRGPNYFNVLKIYSILVDQKEINNQISKNISAPFTPNDQMPFEDLDKQVKQFAERILIVLKKGEAFDEQLHSDIQRFQYLAQRKYKLMKIHRRITIMKVKSRLGDLISQQGVLINLYNEIFQELQDSVKNFEPLQLLQNKLASIGVLKNDTVTRIQLQQCSEQLANFPAIQFMCESIIKEDKNYLQKTFEKLQHGIKSEITAFENSFQSIFNQFSIIRATQDLVSDGKGPEAVLMLQRLLQEVGNNQKYIFMSTKITEFVQNFSELRKTKITENLAQISLDNIIYEASYENFENVDEAIAKEDKNFLRIYNQEKTNERIYEEKLLKAAGKMETEFNQETSHEAENILEYVFQFRQKTNKLVKLVQLLNKQSFLLVRDQLIQELNALQKKQLHYETLIQKMRNLLINISVIPLSSAKIQIETVMKDYELPAQVRLWVQHTINYVLTEDRTLSQKNIELAIDELDIQIKRVVLSQTQINEQIVWVENIENQKNILENKENFKINIENFQSVVLFDPQIEQTLRIIRGLIVDGQVKQAAIKIRQTLLQEDGLEYRIQILAEDIDALYDQIQIDFQNKQVDTANRHSQQLFQYLQQIEKDADTIFLLRRIAHLSQTQDFDNSKLLINRFVVSLQKEYFSIQNFTKQVKDLIENLTNIQKEGDNHLKINEQIAQLKQQQVMNYQVWNILNQVLVQSAQDDHLGANKSLTDALNGLSHLVVELNTSLQLVEKQREFLNSLQYEESFFGKIHQILDSSRGQTLVFTDDSLTKQFQNYWKLVLNQDLKNGQEVLKKMQIKVASYVQKIQLKLVQIDQETDYLFDDTVKEENSDSSQQDFETLQDTIQSQINEEVHTNPIIKKQKQIQKKLKQVLKNRKEAANMKKSHRK